MESALKNKNWVCRYIDKKVVTEAVDTIRFPIWIPKRFIDIFDMSQHY